MGAGELACKFDEKGKKSLPRIGIREEKRRDKQMTGMNATVVSPVISNSTRSIGNSGVVSISGSFRGYTLRSCFFSQL